MKKAVYLLLSLIVLLELAIFGHGEKKASDNNIATEISYKEQKQNN